MVRPLFHNINSHNQCCLGLENYFRTLSLVTCLVDDGMMWKEPGYCCTFKKEDPFTFGPLQGEGPCQGFFPPSLISITLQPPHCHVPPCPRTPGSIALPFPMVAPSFLIKGILPWSLPRSYCRLPQDVLGNCSMIASSSGKGWAKILLMEWLWSIHFSFSFSYRLGRYWLLYWVIWEESIPL